jgi:pimeloyl-ACP methyl ester carboxylesterase
VLAWTWQGKTVELGLDWRGEGHTVLLLPALSSISTRLEMRPLQERLSSRFRTVALDWPGFGDRPRPRLDWSPDVYAAFLEFLLTTIDAPLHAVIAAGHGAVYALSHGAKHRSSIARLVLLAPTWRGPLPTMMKGDRPFFRKLARAVDLPVLGAMLYQLNVNRVMVRRMASGHVYDDPAWLTDSRLREKLAVTRAHGARFASVRFVTGMLDPLKTRADFLSLARGAGIPMLTIYGGQTPARSRAEMECLTALPEMRSARLPVGKLALHEEFPDQVAPLIDAFLTEGPAAARRG